jgi:U3 small nucleolar RNA-associated protein 18
VDRLGEGRKEPLPDVVKSEPISGNSSWRKKVQRQQLECRSNIQTVVNVDMASMEGVQVSNAPTRRRTALADSKEKVVREKDETELRLEKALFGDEAGFLESLTSRQDEDRALQRLRRASDDGSDDEEEEDLAEVPDEDLFFLDAGTGELPASVQRELEADKSDKQQTARRAVWYDSDDDRLTVSLATNTRLRKLRDSLDEDVVSGREYIERLRRQYERLHPTPEWVTHARKKRKLSNGTQANDDSDSDVSMDDSPSIRPVQPLSELLRSAGSLTRTTSQTGGKHRPLRPEVIDIQRTKDVVVSNQSSIDVLHFHPTHPLLLTAGPNSTVSLYHISPQPPNPNPLLTSLHITNTPIRSAAFCISPTTNDTDPTQIILSSRRRYFHTWSLSTGTITRVSRALHPISTTQRSTESFKISPCSRYIGFIATTRSKSGGINILSTATMTYHSTCHIDSAGGVADFDWWRDGEGICVVGKNGEVSEYHVSERQVLARWHDEGAVGTMVLACGGPGKHTYYIAIGSSSGIVNVYDRRAASFKPIMDAITSSLRPTPKPSTTSSSTITSGTPSTSHRPTPLKSLSHLTTPTSSLTFSASAQLLIIASRWKKNALKLVHLPSCTVYKNWPTDKTPLGRVTSVALSGGGYGDNGAGSGNGGGYLAVGSEGGKVRLWEIRG